MTEDMPVISISIPARAEYVHVLRSVIASIAALRNFSYDDIDDLRIAVDEACAHLLAVRAPARSLRLRVAPSDSAIEVIASTDAAAGEWPQPGSDQTLTWQVLSALAEETSFERAEEGPAIRFAKSRHRDG
jgi:serine/threonine-protein kinase RsbW